MVEPINAYCHIGIVFPMIFPQVTNGDGPILESLEKILSDDYFTAIEVTWMKDPQVRKDAAAMLAAAHVDVIFAGQPPLLTQKLSLNAPDLADRKRAVEQCKQSADQAYELGARILAVLSGPDPGDAERAAQSTLLVDSLKQVCAYAQEQGKDYPLAVALESFDREYDKRSLVGPTREAAQVAEQVKQEFSNFGLLIDLSHQPLLGEAVHSMVIDSIDHLIQVHIGNCVMRDTSHPSYGDQHPPFGIPGGENDVEQVKRFLEALIYAGYFKKNTPTSMPVISFEVKPRPGEPAGVVIANAKRTLNEAWAKI
jgi:sugar phosphate isomerase/epimerase